METIKKNRPNLTESSMKTYGYILKRLLKQMKLAEEDYKKILDNPKKVMEAIQDQAPQSRKTVLAVLISLFGRNEKTDMFNQQMLQDAKTYNNELKSQRRTPKQEENWISWGEVLKTYQYLYKKSFPLLKKERVTRREMTELVDFVMLSLYVLIPPRRSSDYTMMKIRNFNKEKDNYVDLSKGELVFNNYKTNKTYGTQSVKVTPKLKTILKKWIAINPTDNLLVDSKGNPLAVSRLTIRMNEIFGKRVSTSMLRHIFVTDVVLKNAPKLNELEDVASSMGHSVSTQANYRVT